MASMAICARVVGLLVMVVASHCLTMDQEATNNVIAAAGSAREDDEVAIVVRGPHGRNARREELLHIKGSEDSAMSLFYNHKSNKVSLESLHDGHLKSVSWGLGSSPRGTLLLVVTANRVKLAVGCRSLHWHAMNGRHDLMTLLSGQNVKLYHEENAPVEVYGNERAALDLLSCSFQEDMKPPALVTSVDDSDVEEVKDFIEKDARWKREEEEMQGDDYRTNYIDANGVLPQPTTQRGDIPSSGIESCDDEVIRQLSLLRTTIDNLRREIADQKGTIDNLRGQLHSCCNKRPACTGSSCYPGY